MAQSSIIGTLLKDTYIPRVARIRQRFPQPLVPDIEAAFLDALRRSEVLERILPGMTVAVGAGSRGIANQPLILRLTVREIAGRGGAPFVFPAMGSHGGATAQGQRDLLARIGITEASVGAPVRATMETVDMGKAENGITSWFDADAAGADGIVLINRIKPHTSFRGKYESGLMKMIAIGLGKQKGAETCHKLGIGRMVENIAALGRHGLATGKIFFGIALLENAYQETCRIEVLPAEEIEAREIELQAEAKVLEPRILFDTLDVLIIDEIGKEISGTGFDTNVVGRFHTPDITSEAPRITRIAVLDITDGSHGNGNGLGNVDFTTARAFAKFSFEETYPNALTSCVIPSVKIPMVLGSDRLAIQAAVKTSLIPDSREVRFGRIKNTLRFHEMEISENLLAEARTNPDIDILSEPYELPFNGEGNLW